MSKILWQIQHQIDGLIPQQAKLTRRIWLKPGEIFLEKKSRCLDVHLLHEGEHTFRSEEKILPYLKFAPLLSSNSIQVGRGTGFTIASKEVLGKDTTSNLHGAVSVSLPEEAVEDIERNAPKFLRKIRSLHNSYIDVVNENNFLAIAMDFFFDANNKSVFRDEGFLCAVIGLEALFNEGSSDINYKISHRAAFLLGLGGDNAVDAFENFKSIYKDRSKLTHGQGSLDDKHCPQRYKVER